MRRLDVYQRLLGYLKPYRLQVIITYVSVLLALLLSLIVPQIIKGVIDNGLANKDASALFIAAGVILGIALLRGLVGFGHRFFGFWLSYQVGYDLRNQFYEHLQTLPLSFS